jgi:glycosyltransferase involved in cell wall biosynthesis
MNPAITVIVPYHNEKDSIEFTLARVGEQTLSAQAAVFVNSMSTDDSSSVVDDWIRHNQHRFTTRFINHFEGTNNPASSKNAGIGKARTEWLAFMDCGQHFDRDWLELQYRFACEKQLDVVSGVVYLAGENWVDRCAVAQTYGFKRNRPCVPTTLARKTVFERTGPFLDGRRAGYDVAWIIKLKSIGIERGINEAVKISYIGVNFSANLASLYKKSVMYARPSVAIEGYWMPYAYVVAPGLFAISATISLQPALWLLLAYFLARALAIPMLKSSGFAYYREHPFEALFGLGIVGLVIDVGKTIGTWQGLFEYGPLKSAKPPERSR